MLCVSTFSGFLPSLLSSSVVWVNPGAAAKPSKTASGPAFFMASSRKRPSQILQLGFLILGQRQPVHVHEHGYDLVVSGADQNIHHAALTKKILRGGEVGVAYLPGLE